MSPRRTIVVVIAVLAASCTSGAASTRGLGPSTAAPSAPGTASPSPPSTPVLTSSSPHAAAACGSSPTAGEGDGGGALVVFWSDSPIPSLWSVRPGGSGLHRLFRSDQNAKRPALSPDRRWVAFDGTPPGKPPLSVFHVQVERVDGAGRRTIASRGSSQWELDAQWSPDGRWLSFSRMPAGPDWRHSRIWTVRPDGTGAHRLGRGTSARWSPDGKYLVVSATTPRSDGDIFMIDADGGGRHRLTATPDLEQPAAWFPNGKKILFTRFELDGGDVFVMKADGTQVRRLTTASGDDIAGSWSPDGSKILFTSGRTGRSQLFVMDADGCNQRILSPTPTYQFDPTWR